MFRGLKKNSTQKFIIEFTKKIEKEFNFITTYIKRI